MKKTTEKTKEELKHYTVKANGETVKTEAYKPPKIEYDSVVDYGSFRPDKEEERIFRLTGAGGNGTVGKYDGEETPSDIVTQIRQGKLDKAEVQKIQEIKTKQYKEENQEKTELEIAKARQDFLDKETGFTGQAKDKGEE